MQSARRRQRFKGSGPFRVEGFRVWGLAGFSVYMFFKLGVSIRVLFKRVPYYIGIPKRTLIRELPILYIYIYIYIYICMYIYIYIYIYILYN